MYLKRESNKTAGHTWYIFLETGKPTTDLPPQYGTRKSKGNPLKNSVWNKAIQKTFTGKRLTCL